jgi:secreted trypsin-like serine protease
VDERRRTTDRSPGYISFTWVDNPGWAGLIRAMTIRKSGPIVLLCGSLLASPAAAIVGGGSAASPPVSAAIVTVVGSRGNFCTGALIAPDLVLTAAHCVLPGAIYKVVDDSSRTPRLLDAKNVASHPAFNLQTLSAHRATADVALLQLAAAAPAGKSPAAVGTPQIPFQPDARFTVAGIGVAVRGDGRTGGVARAASLVVTGNPGTLQIRLVDPLTLGQRDGLGACTGDSGAPVFEDQEGRPIIIGVVSWSTAANNAGGCGGFTGVTPLTLYRDWILKTARAWGARL